MVRNLMALIKPVRAFLAIAACVMLLFSVATPAMAIGSDRSNPSEGEVQLDNIYNKAERALEAEPRNMKEVQAEAKQGFNEIQGSADANKMNQRGDAEHATTVKEQVEKILDDVTHR